MSTNGLTNLGRRASRRRGQSGLSMVEVVIMLTVMTALTGVLAPAGMSMVQQARELQVAREGGALRDAVLRMLVDSNRNSIRLGDGRGPRVDLLVSEGAVPDADGTQDARWLRTPDTSGTIDVLDHYLVQNAPAGSAANAWPTPSSLESGGWRGGYVSSVPASDPWGHRYAINVRYLDTRNDVIVLSAGANGLIETPYEGRGLLPGGDDRATLVR